MGGCDLCPQQLPQCSLIRQGQSPRDCWVGSRRPWVSLISWASSCPARASPVASPGRLGQAQPRTTQESWPHLWEPRVAERGECELMARFRLQLTRTCPPL